MGENVQQQCRDGQLRPGRCGDGDQTHVFHGGVREHALEIALADEQGGGDGDGQQPDDEQAGAQEPGAQGNVEDGLEAQQDRERHGQQHAAHERRDRRRGLAVGVGQPRVEGHQPGFGAIADQQQTRG